MFGQMVLSLTDDEIQKPSNAIRRGGSLLFACGRTVKAAGMSARYVVYQNPKTRADNIAGFLHALEEMREKLSGFRVNRNRNASAPETQVGRAINGFGRYGFEITSWNLDGRNRCMKCSYQLPVVGSLGANYLRKRFESVFDISIN